ncbi:MAG TPA: efflux RND transporter periplasmic adaptor subunit [Bryobacteraceae bacterium]|nr:efflux RND transporter periplasmic adaptor subunit [Bryobacteraceae bacterium]
MRKKLILIAILAAIGGYWGYTRWRDGAEADTIRLSGNIELTEVDIAFKTAGKLVELNVDEGDAVSKGQTLARLDKAEFERTLDRENAGVDVSRSALAQLHTSIEFQQAAIDGDIALRAADLRQAESRLKELQTGSRPQEIEQARAVVAEAQTQHAQASADWTRAQRLIANDDITRQQFDQFRTRYDASAATLKRASETLKLVQEGPRVEQIDQARAAVDKANAALRLSEANKIDLKRRRQEVAMRQADVQRASAQAGVLQSQINDREIASPVDGVVLSKSAETGEVLAGGAALLTVGDIDRPWVRGYIGERDLGRVRIGMPAEVTTDSYPGKVYRGKITFINSEAEFTPKQIQTTEERVKLVYRVKIEVENPNRELKSNMPVDAVIKVK